jgi:hypothetical protein
MQQQKLLIETLADAVADVAAVYGGRKVLAGLLWPTKTPQEAHTRLLDCLNPERSAKLAPGDVMMIARLGRERGCHAVMQFMCADAGYEPPVAIRPAEVERDLVRQMHDLMQAQSGIMTRLEAFRASSGGCK